MSKPVAAIPIPAHGGDLRALADAVGIQPSELLDFSANLHPSGPPRSAVQAMHKALASSESYRNYPGADLRELRSALAGYSVADVSQLLIANGMAPLLDAALAALKPRRCLLPIPAFGEYRRILENRNVETFPLPLAPEMNFLIQPTEILEAIDRYNCDAVLLANPQNPSGALLALAEMRPLLDALNRRGTYILLDEAFIDFVPNESAVQYVDQTPNLIVFRSVTKFFALAGLRIAYACASSDLCKKTEHYIAPWPVSTLAAEAVTAAVKDEPYISRALSQTQRERVWLAQRITALGIHVFPAHANYLLFRVSDSIDATPLWSRLLTHHRIATRNCANFEGLDNSYLRVAVRSRRDNLRLVAAIADCLSQLTANP